jgi:hypothetical protein
LDKKRKLKKMDMRFGTWNNKSRRMRWAGHVARMGERRNAYRMLMGKPGAIIPLGRPRCRCMDNIKMDLRKIEWGGMD